MHPISNIHFLGFPYRFPAFFHVIIVIDLKGIAVAGSGLGTFIFAPLVAFFIQKLGWRNTILVLSAIVLMCAAFGSLFRPLKSSMRKIPDEPFGMKIKKKKSIFRFIFLLKINLIFLSDQKEQNYEIEIIQSNGQNGFSKKKPIDLTHIPTINIIPEEQGRKVRSQSLGNRKTLKQTNTNGGGGAVDADTRSFFSETLLNNISFGKRFRSLDNVHRYSTGALARPDIFYQGPLSNIPHYRSHSELMTVFENGSNGQINGSNVR